VEGRKVAGARKFTWTVEADRYVNDAGELVGFGELDQRALEQAALDGAAIIRRLGGVVYEAAQRVEVRVGEYETAGILFEWKSFAPAVRRPRDEESPLSEEEIEAHFAEQPEPAEVS
jgi:hypothetical protein